MPRVEEPLGVKLQDTQQQSYQRAFSIIQSCTIINVSSRVPEDHLEYTNLIEI